MNKIIYLLFPVIIFSSCSKEEEKFELFSPEAYAFSIGDEWELNASCRAKGFIQQETYNNYSAKLSFNANLQTPDGNLLKNISEGIIDKSNNERIMDVEIEVQVQLDKSYQSGKYKIILNVTDDLSQKTLSIEKEFELTID
ncbi:MAG: hypothetical protein FJ214_11315 [Ignavibacteria bacterium]|nr:hypothetical protein [Ignavibacteria bacterium]